MVIKIFPGSPSEGFPSSSKLHRNDAVQTREDTSDSAEDALEQTADGAVEDETADGPADPGAANHLVEETAATNEPAETAAADRATRQKTGEEVSDQLQDARDDSNGAAGPTTEDSGGGLTDEGETIQTGNTGEDETRNTDLEIRVELLEGGADGLGLLLGRLVGSLSHGVLWKNREVSHVADSTKRKKGAAY